MNLKGKLEVVSRTDVGRVRDHNEDYVSANERLGIAILADGMGGLNAGEVASAMSVDLLMDELTAWRRGRSAIESELDTSNGGLALQSHVVKLAVEKANKAVFDASRTQPQCQGMGTTLVVALFHDNTVSVAHIGDSRLYRFRDNAMVQLTRDHSFVQESLDKGLYTARQARVSTRKNVVTRAMGVAPTVEVDMGEHEVLPADLYLLCSDGLTDLVSHEDIETGLREHGSDLKAAADYLIDVANASGGKDNISIILCRVNKPFPSKDHAPGPGKGGLINKVINRFW